MEKYYFGYTLLRLSCYNTEHKGNIPLLLRFTSAKRHDSVSFLAAFDELGTHMPALSIENICLNPAMDNYPTYRLLKDRDIQAFTDLNNKCGRPKTIPNTITTAGYLMWRCTYGKDHCSRCKNPCTNPEYGRVIKTRPEWDIRLYTEVPRGTNAYKKIHNQRTVTERINNRILNNYGLHHMSIHTREHYSFITTMIGICIHLDARYKQSQMAA